MSKQLTDNGDLEKSERYPRNENLLPDPEEIVRLRAIDPSLVLWVLKHSAKEQQARHNLAIDKLKIIEAEQNRLFKIDVLTITCAFVLMCVGMTLSYLILRASLPITSGILAGSTVIFAAIAFLNFRRSSAHK